MRYCQSGGRVKTAFVTAGRGGGDQAGAEPVPLAPPGADFDNDSTFMNDVVVPWCRAQ
jgi:hypothetical protein